MHAAHGQTRRFFCGVYQLEIRFARIVLVYIYAIEVWQFLLIGGEMGNETYIDLLLVSSELSPPNFILIQKSNFYTNLM